MTKVNIYIHRGAQAWDFSAFARDDSSLGSPDQVASMLTGAIRDPSRFVSLLDQIKGLPQAEVAQIAKAYFGGGSYSSKAAAIKAFQSAHSFVMASVYKNRATGGRSAF